MRDPETAITLCYRLVVALSVVGIAITAYLTVTSLTGGTPTCGGLGDCHSVLGSKYASFLGIPISIFGLIFYGGLVLGGLTVLALEYPSERLELALIGMAGAGVLASAYLTVIEIFVVKAICPYCVASAAILVTLLALTWVAGRYLPSRLPDYSDELEAVAE
jgi:uncharacterized membrane protein